MQEIGFIELYAGVGGFRYGLEKANKEKFKCVWANELDKYASAIYRYHYGRIIEGDIRTVDISLIPDHQMLCAGFPCQSFSRAGRRRGFTDTRGTLYFEVIRIARIRKPQIIFLENVQGLLSHDKGYTFEVILRTMDELGYDCQWQVLNSKHFGVPQNRPRVYIIGHLRGTRRPEVFPFGEGFEVHEGVQRKTDSQQPGIQDRSAFERPDSINGDGRRENVPGPGRRLIHNVYGGFHEGLRIFEDYSPTIRTPSGGGHLPLLEEENGRLRQLTPIEKERLQGFPDDWTLHGMKDEKVIKISNYQRERCMGNAVTTNVITAIGERLNEI